MAGKKGRSGGQNRKPVETKLLQGTFRPDQQVANVPPPVLEEPKPPEYLSDRAREIWDAWIRHLGPAGRNILTRVDDLALAAAATSFAEYERKPSAGREAQLRGWIALLGISPRDRQSIPSIAPPKPAGKVLKPRGAK